MQATHWLSQGRHSESSSQLVLEIDDLISEKLHVGINVLLISNKRTQIRSISASRNRTAEMPNGEFEDIRWRTS